MWCVNVLLYYLQSLILGNWGDKTEIKVSALHVVVAATMVWISAPYMSQC